MHEKKNSALVMLSVSLAAIALWNVALPVWNGASLSDSLWDISGCCAAASAWGVPLLIAGMGCRYLTGDPVYSVGFILKKRLPRAFAGLAVWWLVSTLFLMKNTRPDEIDTDTFFETMAKVLETPYQVKLLMLVVMLFAFYPLLKRIADNEKLTAYAVTVFAVMSVIVPVLRYIPYLRYINLFASQINWGFFTEFGLYLFLGVFLSRRSFEWHYRVVIYCAGVLSTVAMYSTAVWTYTQENGMDNTFVSEASPFVAVQVSAVIVLIMTLCEKSKNKGAAPIWNAVARCSYVYIPLCAIVVGITNRTLSTDALSPAISIPVNAAISLIVALTLSAVFRRLPILSYFSV